MKKQLVNSVEEAFALEGLDPENIQITGVPERHVKALKSLAKLFVVHDACNPTFTPDYSNRSQKKYENVFKMHNAHGNSFEFEFSGIWNTDTYTGARLVSENRETGEHIAQICEEQYKAFMVYERPVQNNVKTHKTK